MYIETSDITNVNIFFPCHKGNKYHKYYKGDKDFNNCPAMPPNNNQKCEWLSSRLVLFVLELNKKESKTYTLVKCLDNDYRDRSQPEVELVDINDENNKILIEVKSINTLKYMKKQDEASFMELYNSLEVENMLSKNSKLNLLIQENPVLLEIGDDIRWGKKKKQENIKKVISQISNIADNGFNHKSNFLVEEFKVGGIIFKFGVLTDECGRENGIQTGLQVCTKMKRYNDEYSPPKEEFLSKLNEFYSETVNKFKNCENYNSYKKILLLINKSNYSNNEIKSLVESSVKPDKINEIWYAKDKYEIIDEYCNEESVGIDYEQIL